MRRTVKVLELPKEIVKTILITGDHRHDVSTKMLEERVKKAPIPIFQRLVVTTAASVFVMNILGSYVSASGAGTACPDWPLCPEISNRLVLLEFLHRAWGGVVSLLTVATIISAYRFRDSRPTVIVSKKLVYAAGVVLLIQIFLGALVVLTGLRAELVALHQALAMTILSFFVASASILYASRG